MVSFGRGLAAGVGGQRGRSARGIPAGARRRGPRWPRSALPGLPPREGGAPAVARRRGRKVSGAARAEGCASAECPRTGGDSRGAGAGGGEGRGWSGGGGAAVSGRARRCASGARRGSRAAPHRLGFPPALHPGRRYGENAGAGGGSQNLRKNKKNGQSGFR